jgi:hypothetical protein
MQAGITPVGGGSWVGGIDGTLFGPEPSAPLDAPTMRPIALPDFEGAYASWGATGRDRHGHIWVGVSAHEVRRPSAHLFEYFPDIDRVVDRGDVVAQLERLGLARRGEGQMKIHSRIVPASDGYLYFASMDEQGEATDGSRLPTWGSHLWRIRPEGGDWEHLLAVPEGLIAVSGGGTFLYALGYFDHTLYQFDTRTGESRSIRVGSAGGHVSRNFLSDERGHAYVPRLRSIGGAGSDHLATTLVEFAEGLNQLAETPIRHYTQTRDDESHGIVGVVHLAGGAMVFATDQGYLYRVDPRPDGPAAVKGLGYFHPRGESYAASLFTHDGVRRILGVSRRGSSYDWVVFDLTTGLSTASPLAIPGAGGAAPGEVLLYGSITRDDAGRFYLAGTYDLGRRSRPLFWQLIPGVPPARKRATSPSSR